MYIHWSELRYLDLHRRSASVNHVVTSVASAVSNCNTHKCSIARRQERSKIFCNVNCKTPNVIFLLDCHVCGSQYVGESVQPFNKRMNGHRSDLTKKTLLLVSKHFVSPGHSLDDFGRSKIYIIDHNRSWKENQRQKKELLDSPVTNITYGRHKQKGLNLLFFNFKFFFLNNFLFFPRRDLNSHH